MRTILVVVVLSWSFLFLRLTERPAKPAEAQPVVETFSASCSYERTDTVGGAPAATEKRTGSCFGPSGEAVAARR